MNTNPMPEPMDLQEALTSYARAIGEIARHASLQIVLHTRPGAAVAAALAAARATLLADLEGEPDPLWYLRDELAARGQLPFNPWGRA